MEIYRRSFPYKEQRSEEDHIRALADPAFRAEGIWRGDEFVGILYYWHTDEWDYVEHLAICASLRGQNLGSEVFGTFCRDRRVILEIDPPVDEISIRRLHFYRRLGFVENPHEYIHPSYRQPFEPHRLVLLSRPTPLTDDEARRFADFIRETVLRYTEHEAPDHPRL